MADDGRAELGRLGEDLACRELERRGYAIVQRRFRTRAGEMDIVARDGATLVFLEVKARRGERCGPPVEAVTWRKRLRLVRIAQHYLALHGGADGPCRFDIVAVAVGPGRTEVEVYANAFDATGLAV